jgi:hypothetical protein
LLRLLRQIPLEARIFLEIYREGMRAHEIGQALAMPRPSALETRDAEDRR